MGTPIIATKRNLGEKTLLRESGANLLEYSLLTVLICLIAVVSIREIGRIGQEHFNSVTSEIGGEVPPADVSNE